MPMICSYISYCLLNVILLGSGISSYTDDPEGAGTSLLECLRVARSRIPSHKHIDTPVYLGATAGMRLLKYV